MEEKQTPAWLKRIQENSWEPEILISGGAIYALFSLSDLFLEWHRDIRHFMNFSFVGQKVLIWLFVTVFEGLKVMFLVHLILRGFWTGMVGLSYLSKGRMEYDSYKFVGRFNKLMEREADINAYILKLERICSIVFVLSIRMVLSTLGLVFMLLPFVIIAESSHALNIPDDLINVLLYTYGFFLFVFGIDSLSLGKLRRFNRLEPFYYPVYKVFSYISLTVLQRRILFTLTKVVKVKNGFPIAAAIMGISLFLAYNKVTKHRMVKAHYAGEIYEKIELVGVYAPAYYLNQWKEGDYKPPYQLGRDVVADYSTLMLFIEYAPDMEEQIEIKTVDDLKSNLIVTIDNNPINKDVLVFGKNPMTERRGLIGYLNCENLEPGKHELRIYSAFNYSDIPYEDKPDWWLFGVAPFWKE